MGVLYITITFFVSVIILSSVHCNSECNNVTCPQQLDCTYPKVSVVLPDPNNKDCCNVTECICEGTSSRLSSSNDPVEQYETLRMLYENCTMIDGNLEIVYIHPDPSESFWTVDITRHIRIVTGYVLISVNYIHYIDLSSLRLIRGEQLYTEQMSKVETCKKAIVDESNGHALYVTVNFQPEPNMGLKEIHMPLLTEIMRGDVKISDNRDLCFVDSIIWAGEIFNSDEQKFEVRNNSVSCPPCPASCVHPKVVDGKPHCWANSESKCQQFTKKPCSVCPQRCNLKGICCESYCAAGCTETKECHACKHFNDFGKCVSKCDTGSTSIGNDVVSQVDKSLVKYELFWHCVQECPVTRRIFERDRKCVLTCPYNYFSEGGYCKECPPGGCSHICYGLEAKLGPLKYDDIIHSENIGNFTKNCTIIEGSLNFRRDTFLGDFHCNIPPLNNSRAALEVFENVEEITGFLNIEYWPYKDMCIFKNLKRIRGYEKRRNAYSLLIMTDSRVLRQLCFNSLEEIETGIVYAATNRGLCYADMVNWEHFFLQPNQKTVVGKNAKKRKCLPCNSNCDPRNGCWGPDSDQCVTCQIFTDYTDASGLFTDRWVIDPVTNKFVPGHNATTCVETCDALKGVYPTPDRKCFPCDLQCNQTCAGPGPTNCTLSDPSTGIHGCKNVNLNDTCKEKCPESHYQDNDRACRKCSDGCLDGGCNGPADDLSKDGCSRCFKKYDIENGLIIYRGTCQICNDELKDLKCALGCTQNNETDDYQCYHPPSNEYIIWIIVGCVLILIASVIAVVLLKCRKTIRTMRKHIGDKIVGDAAQPDDFDTPLTPSGTAPNQAQLRIVKENELAIGKELGAGAFGAVYKAVWTSMLIEGQTIKIPVAVKQLKTFTNSSEIMEEACMMASVDNPYLIRLLGICMSGQVSLITQLMPLGSLLEYVRGNTDSIGSRHMLTWCTQIAKGMQYLEEKHLVHRDLAARNVLVKTPHHVKITDFGLSKMLDATQSAYYAEGGKLPIKWLAIECITQRKFSHQSDVWAFGVTCWEIFTFGARPYDGVRAVDVLQLLQRGDRLIQPSMCTIEVYMLLIKCWLVDPSSRSRFSELVEEFTKMCHDHSRYLVVKNDSNPGLMSPNPEEEKRFFQRLIREDNDDVDGELMLDDPDTYLLSRAGAPTEVFPHYSFMAPATSSISKSAVEEPEYQNQPIVDRQVTVNGSTSAALEGCNGHDARLFSRNTPSAQLPTPPAHFHTSVDPITEVVLSRMSDSSNPDDVFANSGNTLQNRMNKSMTVDLPNSEKGVESRSVRYRSNQGGNPWVAQGRKDSEENSRYTEDPTKNNRSSDCDSMAATSFTVNQEVLSTSNQPDGILYDEEDYLLPTPHLQSQQSTADNGYIDPVSPNNRVSEQPVIQVKNGSNNEFRASLSNNTYLENGDMPLSLQETHPSAWSNRFVPQGYRDSGAEYVNSPQDREYLNWNGDRTDAMMSDVLARNDNAVRPLLDSRPSGSQSPGTRRRDEVTNFNNEEYMTTDSGIGEDSHSVLSGSHGGHGTRPVQTSRNRQNSSLSSADSSNGSLGPLIAGSPAHRLRLGSDEQQMDLDRGSVHYRPVPSQRSQKRPQKNASIGLDNPEYMLLQKSVSDSKALLDMDTGSTDA